MLRRLVRYRFLAGILVPGLVVTAAAQDSPPLTSISALRSVPGSEAAKRTPVRVRGVVTLLGEGIAPYGRMPQATLHFCIEEAGTGIWVSVIKAREQNLWRGDPDTLLGLHIGSEIELEGILEKGLFSPFILPNSIQILGEKTLPPPEKTALRSLLNGGDDVRRVRVSGVVQSMTPDGELRWLLKVDTGLGYFLTHLPKTEAFLPSRILDAEVEFKGLAAVQRNWRNQFVRPRIILSGEEDVLILKAPNPDPFAAKKVPLAELDTQIPGGRPRHRQRIEGTVTYLEPKSFLILQENNCAVRVETSGTDALSVGDRCEASGFIDTSREVAGLGGAVVRSLGSDTLPPARAVTFSEILADFEVLKISRTPKQTNGYDGLLVHLTGRLLSTQRQADGLQRLELDCGDSISTAFLRGPYKEFRPGSELRVTGIASLQTAQTLIWAKPVRLDVLLRDGNDIAVLQTPSWWTLQRTSTALFGVFGLALAALAWAAALRRRVQAQTQQLANEMRSRRDAAVEFQAALRERSRLAANLHDTVLQTVTGLGLQIEACEAGLEPHQNTVANNLSLALKMAHRGQDDLRNAVWAMQALPLNEGTFGASVRAVVRQISAGRSIQILVSGEEGLPVLADFIAGNLLLILQESIHNALKHSNPSQIQVTLASIPKTSRLSITIQDDGIGFVPGSQPGQATGHFGLIGMRERAERLGGTLQIQSAPGKGTSIQVDVPLRSFDEALN